MNNEKKYKSNNFKFMVSKIAQAVLAVGGMATVYSCTLFFHEKKVPNELLNNNPFVDKE
ncbi:hypothetical protein ACIQ34_07490 [Ureibacillus sp. NPDC094379]